jgi:hypothetical protein
MNEGIQLILKRMESHPEEFSDYETQSLLASRPPDKWDHIMTQVRARVGAPGENPNRRYLPFLSDEEVQLVYDKWVSLQSPVFTDAVMRVLLLDEVSEEYVNYPTMRRPANPSSGPATIVRTSRP